MKVIIIGGVAGGASAAARLRRLDENAEIILVERGEYISYANCGLPYHLGGVIPERNALLVMKPENFRERFQIDVRTQCEGVGIDRENKQMRLRDLSSGQEYMERYDKLILSTGSSPMPIEIPSASLDGIFNLWTLSDMDKLNAYLDGTKNRALVIGGGFVGIELAENLKARGLGVTLIQRGRGLLPTMDYEMSSYLIQELRRSGIEVMLNASVESFARDAGGLRATLAGGGTLDADVAVFSIGVRPNSELAQSAGLRLGPRGHIVTDDFLRTSDPDIYAVGDIIEVNDPILATRTAIALAGPANRQGRMAADNIAGRSSTYGGTIGTSVIKVGGLTAGTLGYTEKRLQDAGAAYEKIYLHPNSNASYYPGGSQLHIKVLFNKDSGKIYGAQIVGRKGVDKRIDVLATAVRNQMKIQDLAGLELAYAPPYGSAKDPVNLIGMIAENVVCKDADVAHFETLPPDAYLLDVREPEENETGALDGALNIPLNRLRERLNELPKERRIYVYCQSGLRGYLAERILKQHGFDAANLSGGYLTWKAFQEPEKVASPAAMPVTASTAKPPPAANVIDARALACPGPIIRMKQEIDRLQPGDSLEIMAPLSFESDLNGWLKTSGHELLRLENKGDYIQATIRKKPADGKSAIPAAASCDGSAGQGGAIVLFSNDLDKAMAALIIACGMAAAGRKVGIFFTFWGLSVLRREQPPAVKKNVMSRLFGWMLPKGAGRLSLSKMNMGGMGTLMMKQVMAGQNVTTLPELIQQARGLGVKFIACEMAMGVMGLTREELIEVDDVAGVASFVAMAADSNNTLFI